MKDAVDWHDGIAADFQNGYRTSPAFKERLTLWSDLIARHVRAGDRLLDAGCGAGTLSIAAARHGARVDGIDGSAQMIALAQADADRAGLEIVFHEAMLETLDQTQAGSYDVVLSSSVLEYVASVDDELRRFADILAPGGLLIVSLPNASALYRRIERIAFRLTGWPRYFAHVRQLAFPDKFSQTLRARGFEPIETHYVADPPKPFALLSRVFGAKQKTLFAIVARKQAT